jgi:hypothetical protein
MITARTKPELTYHADLQLASRCRFNLMAVLHLIQSSVNKFTMSIDLRMALNVRGGASTESD